MLGTFTPSARDLRALLSLAVPIVVVHVGLMLMSVVGTTYLGHVSATELAAGALGILNMGAAVGPPTCELSTTNLDFGSVPVGGSRDFTFGIRNAGGREICGTVTEISPELSIVENASYCITSPAFVRVTVRFTPSSTGSIFADIVAGGGCPRLTARGTGI